MIPLGCLNKFAPAELGVEPDEVKFKLLRKGLHNLRLHSTLNDESDSALLYMHMMMMMMMMMMMVKLTIVLSIHAGLPSLTKGTKWPMAATVKFFFCLGFEHRSNAVFSFFAASCREIQPKER